jgi:glycosyltransferase involved in cell wall biosynthesis
MARRGNDISQSAQAAARPLEQTLSVVIPVFRAGEALSQVVDELLATADRIELAPRVLVRLDEVVLVSDNPWLPPSERERLLGLEARDRRVRVVWLTRNFGQHPATVAGIVSTSGDWIATMDEDGQHDPAGIAAMLRIAAHHGTTLVYAKPTNPPPHSALRNAASRAAKRLFHLISGAQGHFHSFRLIEGTVARSACAYMGENVYLDVAMHWSCGDAGLCPLRMRAEGSKSAYNYSRLIKHFGRMVLSSGARPLRLIAAFGVFVGLGGLGLAAFVIQRRLTGAYAATPGWASEIVTLLLLFAVLFITLATLAEYLSFAAGNTIGKPLYVIADPANTRALWRLQAALADAERDKGKVARLPSRRRSATRKRA